MLRLKLLICAVAATLCSLVSAGPATATNFDVNTGGENSDAAPGNGVCEVAASPGVCTIRAAVEEANANSVSDPDTITFSHPGPFNLIFALNITGPVTIDGNGSGLAGTVVQANNPDTTRLFVTTAPVTFKDLRIQDGGLTGGGTGGALSLGGNTTLDNVTVTSSQVTGNALGIGAAIYANQPAATLELINSTISGNTVSTGANAAYAGGIYSAGPLELTDSVVSGNTVTGTGETRGAGVYAEGALSIVRSSITGNTITAGGTNPAGGGMFNQIDAGTREIINSTFSGNSAGTGQGGGLRVVRSMTIESSTFAANSAGGGGADVFVDEGPTVTVRNTILASTATPACLETNPDTLVAAVPGHNIDAGTSCGFGTMDGNKQSTDPMLTGLTPFGNGQMLHLLIFGSPAIDAADPSCGGGLTTDQRGLGRPQGTICDIGAYERDYRLVTVNKTGTGTVTGTGIDCGGDCEESFLDGGADVVLTAAAGAGFQFSSWTGDCESISGNQCTVDVGNHRTVTATFTANPAANPPAETPAKKKCKKGQKLKKGKCVKKKRKKKRKQR